MDYTVHGISLGQNTRVGSFSLLQEIFPTQELDPGLLHCRQILYQLSRKGSPEVEEETDLISHAELSKQCDKVKQNKDFSPCQNPTFKS